MGGRYTAEAQQGCRCYCCYSSYSSSIALVGASSTKQLPLLMPLQNADMTFTQCFVPDSARLPGVNSFKDTNKVMSDMGMWSRCTSGCP